MTKQYVVRRYIDRFIPGDVIPGNRYDRGELASMVANGMLVPIGDDGVIPVTPIVEMSDQELKNLAKDKGIKGYFRMKRETLIERLGELD